jgi:hypothetical protein
LVCRASGDVSIGMDPALQPDSERADSIERRARSLASH